MTRGKPTRVQSRCNFSLNIFSVQLVESLGTETVDMKGELHCFYGCDPTQCPLQSTEKKNNNYLEGHYDSFCVLMFYVAS